MKLQVVVDSMGQVVGTARAGKQKLEDGSEIEFGVVPLEGQEVHDLDFDAEIDFRQVNVEELHQRVARLIQEKR